MAWKKKQVSPPEDNELRRVLRNTNIPILTLDSRWHELFPEFRKTNRIKELERMINDMLKKQGKISDERKEMKKLKQRMMEEIISNMSEDSGEVGRLKQKKQEKSQKMILEINQKLEESEAELDALPEKIKRVNEELLIESLRIWNAEMDQNSKQIVALEEWILNAREKLKENILRKQDMESRNTEMYSYMHNLLGVKVMEQVDLRREK